jgi:class 3 adenylate cyclase
MFSANEKKDDSTSGNPKTEAVEDQRHAVEEEEYHAKDNMLDEEELFDEDSSSDSVVDDFNTTSTTNTRRHRRRRRRRQQELDHPPDGAEHLVRVERRAVRFLRGALILLLVTAASLTGVFTHRIEANTQVNTFTRDFEDVSASFILSFHTQIGIFLYQCYTLSDAMSSGLYAGSTPTFPYVSISDLDGITTSLRYQTRALDILWSPLLRTRQEKNSWEAYANNYTSSNSSSASLLNFCNVCGDGYEIINPNATIVFPGIQGTFSCAEVYNGGKAGLVSEADCGPAKALVEPYCGCQKVNSSVTTNTSDDTSWTVSQGLFRLENGKPVPDHGPPPYSPVWQVSPAGGGKEVIMFNQMSDARRREGINSMVKNGIAVMSRAKEASTDAFYNLLQTTTDTFGVVTALFYPVYDSAKKIIVGSLGVDFSWQLFLELNVPTNSDGVTIVLENTCGQVYSFIVVNGQVNYLGEGDFHDSSFDALEQQSSYVDFLNQLRDIAIDQARYKKEVSLDWGCAYRIRLFPTTQMRARYLTSKPWDETIVVVSIFLFTALLFLLYDFILRRLQTKVMDSAKRSEAIVSSLFPAVVRDRLYGNKETGHNSPQGKPQLTSSKHNQPHARHGLMNHKIRLKKFLAQPTSEDVIRESEPIADLFPNTTILFADIAGFTAWSSEREPAQVFKLLETIYGAFDQVANKRGVFKIETIGDCYVAVSGLPEPREDHAVVMVKFAFECLLKMGELTKSLESSLGPGTADLAIRVGLHSGPVTGGVLRGERARFQLFGDTMNTASRMESNGKVNHIHVSKETAELLIKAGKSDWVEQRSEVVSVKGKGEMQTYWVKPSKPKQRKASISSSEDARSSSGHNVDSLWGGTNLDTALSMSSSVNRRDRLIAWNADLLEQLLQKIVARRKATTRTRSIRRLQSFKFDKRRQAETSAQVVDEITEIIAMPSFSEQTAKDETDPTLVDIGTKARSHLRDYVAHIAALYHDNAFHNFEHASHVVMSASKLLKRIITPDDVDYRADESGKILKAHTVLSREIHETTYGISSDPLMQFAVVFSALIHDVDHTGLQNRQLVKKKDPLALSYLGKCVAEQHSIQCAWHMLMEDRYADLRRCIYQTDEDRLRFRQLVINAVIATDIADKELQTWRQNRWDKAFHEQTDGSTMDRKATLLFEYILQASDVAPTMQHWHVYQKWNQRLFEERYIAFLLGNEEEDPSLSWYQGELAFFDNYVIPLARNLEESNVFGVSCDEYLAYALENRREWEVKGLQIVSEMVASHKSLIAQLGSEHPLNDVMLM